MSADKTRVLQLDIRLRDVEPPIWRRIQVWEDTKLPQLHRIFQMLFNWEDYHLHEFEAGPRVYGIPDAESGGQVLSEEGVPLNRIASQVGDTFVYAYDFGDGWQHDVLIEAVLPPEPDVAYPRCLEGARNGPPEDTGGPFGYADYLAALSNPKHKEHKNMLAWGGPFDAEEFPLTRINASLARTFRRRPAAKRVPKR